MNPGWMGGIHTQFSAESDYNSTGKGWSVFLLPEEIEDAVTRLYDHEFFLEDISAMDSKDGLVVIYHLDHFIHPGRVALYVLIQHKNPEIPSISSIFSGAEWHEREVHDFFGIRFTGHRELDPLLLPEDAGYHPLIKEQNRRACLNEVLNPGQVVETSSDFQLFQKKEVKDTYGSRA